MRVAVLIRPRESLSASVYRNALAPELAELGAELVAFGPQDPIPGGCDVLWYPGSGMGRVPRILLRAHLPIVCTVHGLEAFSLPLHELSAGAYDVLNNLLSRWLRRIEWRRFGRRVARVIAVSDYGRAEVERHLGIDPERIVAIHHGAAKEVFCPEGEIAHRERQFFLHVSAFNPVKNYGRMLEAYDRLPVAGRPLFVMVVPGYRGRGQAPEGVELIKRFLGAPELAALYRGAIGFVFPSLHETFGLPMLEAMSSGCPVITSTETACPETTAGAALLVNPRSVEEIHSSMDRLVADIALRRNLRRRGIERAGEFCWERSARRHLAVFQQAMCGPPAPEDLQAISRIRE